MNKYSLEIENWGEWELERDFSSLERAIAHGKENFPQNQWRIFDRVAGSHVHTHDPLVVMQEEAANELGRFAERDRWRRYFAERSAAEVVARQQRERMAEIASRQRQRQREQEQARRARLQGFNFVGGQRPSVLDRINEQTFHWWDEEYGAEYTDKRHAVEDKVDWLHEGF